MPDPVEPFGLLLCDDLIFASRITGTGRAQGLIIKQVRSQSELETLARQQTPSCVLIDLANAGLVITDLVHKLRACETSPYLVAFGSHVDAATLNAARQAGCDLVLPRSKFVQELATALPRWFIQSQNQVTRTE
jgi:CheY-like chemotaxis protein